MIQFQIKDFPHNYDPIVVNEHDMPVLLKLLHLPVMASFILEPDQLPHLRSAIADQLHFSGELEAVSNNRRYGVKANVTSQYLLGKMKEISLLAEVAEQARMPLEWVPR